MREDPHRSIQPTATAFGIPKPTLRYNIELEKSGINVNLAHALTDAEEDLMIKYVKDCRDRAVPVTKGNIMDMFNDIKTSMRNEQGEVCLLEKSFMLD